MTKSEEKLFSLLRAKYPADRYALIPQVPDGTGANKVRTADAIAMGLWRSRGLTLEGFEFKASRSDWVKELQTPAKAERIARYCHKWWIVVSDAAFVKPGELPDGWGLLAPGKGGHLVVKTAAPMRDPVPVSYEFLAGLLRAAQGGSVQRARLSAEFDRGYELGRKQGDVSIEVSRDHYKRQAERVQQQVAAFQEASGINLGRYDGGQIGAAARLVLEGRPAVDSTRRQLGYLRRQSRAVADQIDQLLNDLDPEAPDAT